jgi:hypothetical protein
MVMPTSSNDEEVQAICQCTTITIQEYLRNLSNTRCSTYRPSLFTCRTDTLLEILPLGAACALPKVDTRFLVTSSSTIPFRAAFEEMRKNVQRSYIRIAFKKGIVIPPTHNIYTLELGPPKQPNGIPHPTSMSQFCIFIRVQFAWFPGLLAVGPYRNAGASQIANENGSMVL